MVNNRTFHTMLVEGVDVEVMRDGRRMGDKARLADFEEPEANEFVVVNQFTILEQGHNRRPDMVVFLNGLPVGVIELKNPADETATIWNAYQQLQTYKQEIPVLFTFNEVLVVSDGLDARIGTLTSPQERVMPWRTIEGETVAPRFSATPGAASTEYSRSGASWTSCATSSCSRTEHGAVAKKLAGYHQFHAVNRALTPHWRPRGPAETSVAAWSGIRRARARASPWSSTRARSSSTRRWRTRRWLCSPTGTTWTTSSSGPSRAARTSCARRRCRPRAGPICGAAQGRLGRRGVHHHPEVLPRGEGRPASGAFRTPQHRRHRRRSPPQPVRLHRRLRPAHARRAAKCIVHRIYRHAHENFPDKNTRPSSATTSASTTSSRPWRMGRPSPSTTRAASPSLT